MNKHMYLVTGAAGFLGGTVCRQLVERGEKVRAFVLQNDKAMKYVPKEAEIIEGDVLDKASLDRFFDVPEDTEFTVLHIASIVYVDPAFNQKVWMVNVDGTRNIIDECLSHKNFRKLVYCGSTGSIPEAPKGEAIHEPDRFDAGKVLGCYSQSKAMAAQYVLDAVQKDGLKATLVHPTGIMGPEDFAVGETTKTVSKIINGEMPAGIDGSFNMVDVRDLAAGVIAAADKGRIGESYILGNDDVSFKEFAKLLHEESKCPKMKMFLPIWLANFMARIMERRAKKQGEKPLMTTFSVYNLARNNRFDCSKAEKELGFHSRSYRETMHDEILWLKQAGLIAA